MSGIFFENTTLDVSRALAELFPETVSRKVKLVRSPDGSFEVKAGVFFRAAMDTQGFVEGYIEESGQNVLIKEINGKFVVQDKDTGMEIAGLTTITVSNEVASDI